MTRSFVICSLAFVAACDVGSVLANTSADGGGSGSGSGCGNLVTPAPPEHTHTGTAVVGATPTNAGVGCMSNSGCHNALMAPGGPSYSYAGTVYTDASHTTPAAGSVMFVTLGTTTKQLTADTAGNFFLDEGLMAGPSTSATAQTSATECPKILPMSGALVGGGGNCNSSNCHGGTQGGVHL